MRSYSSSWVLPQYGDGLERKYGRLSIMTQQIVLSADFSGVCHMISSPTIFNQADSVALGMTVSVHHFGPVSTCKTNVITIGFGWTLCVLVISQC